MLDGFQAGLSWSIILLETRGIPEGLQKLDPKKIASFGEADMARLLEDAGILRSRAKIEATTGGATRLSRDAGGRGRFLRFLLRNGVASRFRTVA
jgi:DNA-3-methyladenine glycosylase I